MNYNSFVSWMATLTNVARASPHHGSIVPMSMESHRPFLGHVPRWPLLRVLETAAVGEAGGGTFDLNTVAEMSSDGTKLSCKMSDNGFEEGSLDCSMIVGGRQYELKETCTSGTDGLTIMTCNICVVSSLKDFQFCYDIACDFSGMVDENVADFTMLDYEQACQCATATINGQSWCVTSPLDVSRTHYSCLLPNSFLSLTNSQRCEICDPRSPSFGQQPEDVGAQLFANLALDCPHMDLVTPYCDIDRKKPDSKSRAPDTQLTSSGNTSTNENDGSTTNRGVRIVLVCMSLLLVGVAFFVFRRSPSRKVTLQPAVSRNADEGVVEMT